MNRYYVFFAMLGNFYKEDVDYLYKKIPRIEDINFEDVHSINGKITRLKFNKLKANFEKIQEAHKKLNAVTITIYDEDYPEKLRHIDNPPRALYCIGDINLLKHSRILAVVGSRKPSAYGIWAAKTIVSQIVQNDFVTVSGFASGIDTIAHKASYENGKKTIMVFGTPLNKIYPAKNKRFFKELISDGNLVISEIHALKQTVPAYFSLRNRIISGLSSSLLVVEAGAKSGTLITVKHALNQGKSIFSVPGNINSKNSIGTNNLIKDGAIMCTSADDILFHYGIEKNKVNPKEILAMEDLSDDEKKVYALVKTLGQCHSEKIALSLKIDIGSVQSILNILDLKGYVNYDGFMCQVNC